MEDFDKEMAELDARLEAMFRWSEQQDQRIAQLHHQVDDVKSQMQDMSNQLHGLSYQFRTYGSSSAHFDLDISDECNR